MIELDFLPSLPIAPHELLVAGLVLLAGIASGELVLRVLWLPRITGYVLAGVLLGPGATGLLDREMLDGAHLLLDVALGLILFELGSRLDFGWLRRNPWLLATSAAESGLCFVLVFAVLYGLGVTPGYAAIGAGIAMGTAPAVLLLVVYEERADGTLTDQALNLTALNSALAVIIVTMLLAHLHLEHQANWYVVLAHPFYLLMGSLSLGIVGSALTLLAARWLGKREELQFMLLAGMILLTVGCALVLKLSLVVALLTLGVVVRNRDRRHNVVPVRFGSTAQILYVVLFVLTGANLELDVVLAVGWIGLGYAAARTLGKMLGILLFAPLTGLSMRKGGLLGLALTPMSTVALVLVQFTGSAYPAEESAQLGAIVLSAVLLFELTGPLAAQVALRLSGDARAQS